MIFSLDYVLVMHTFFYNGFNGAYIYLSGKEKSLYRMTYRSCQMSSRLELLLRPTAYLPEPFCGIHVCESDILFLNFLLQYRICMHPHACMQTLNFYPAQAHFAYTHAGF